MPLDEIGHRMAGVDERMAFGSTTATTLDESQVAVVTGWVEMNR